MKTTVIVEIISPARKDCGKQNPSGTSLYFIIMKFGTNNLKIFYGVVSSKCDFNFIHLGYFKFSLGSIIQFVGTRLMVHAVDTITQFVPLLSVEISILLSPPPIDDFLSGSLNISIVSSPPSCSSFTLYGLS